MSRPRQPADDGALPALPPGLPAYKRTPVFDENTLPAGLRRRHATRPGVWAVIHVLEGRLRFRLFDPPRGMELTPARPGVAMPEQRHEVEPLGAVKFYVAFHAAPAAQPPPQDG